MINSKTVLITGASRGIGKACAFAFANAGYSLIITCQNSKQELFNLAKLLEQKYSVTCLPSVGDIGDEQYIYSLFTEISSHFSRLDVLVNNAGISHIALLQDMKVNQWENLINTNLTSSFLSCRSAVPLMLKNHSGSIVNVSSVWGKTGASLEAAYSATKGGMNAFTRALARELGPSDIRVNAIAFGVIETEMNTFLSPEERESLCQEIPLGRFGTAKEAADLIYDIAVNHPYLTGQIITMDGGWT